MNSASPERGFRIWNSVLENHLRVLNFKSSDILLYAPKVNSYGTAVELKVKKRLRDEYREKALPKLRIVQ